MYHLTVNTLLFFSSVASLAFSAVVPRSAIPRDSNDDWTVQLTSSSVPIDDNFDATLVGSSSDGSYSVNITNNAGTVTQGDRTTNVVVSFQIPWDVNSLTLYGIIGVDSEAILMGWVYCDEGANSLSSVWLEDTTGASGFTSPGITGTCTATSDSDSVNFVSLDETVTITPPSSNPTIDGGSDLSLQPGSVGNVNIANTAFDLRPFTIVDCSDGCGSGPANGWVEVHSVMSQQGGSNVCVGIFYLEVTPQPVNLEYLTCFQDQISSGQTYDATYTIPTQSSASQGTNEVESTSSSVAQGLHAALRERATR